MSMPGRVNNYVHYRYSFNGKELDNEVKGIGNEYDYGFRIYDPRIAKFLSVDPLTHKFPWNSPYSYAEGDVVRSIDLDGTEKKQANHPMGYYSDDNHTTWKSIVKVRGDDKEGGAGGYAELRIQDENGTNFFVLKTRVMHDGVVSHNLAYWTEEPLADGKKYSNEAKWEPFMEAGQEGAQAGAQMDRLFGTFWFGTAFVGAALPALAYATPHITSFALSYGRQALTASAGSRLLAATFNTGFQYIQNLPANGVGWNNFKNINLSSVGLSAINPLSVGVTAFAGTFGKSTIASGRSESVFGNDFNFKNAALNGAINYFGGKLGNGIGKLGSNYMKLTPVQENVAGNALGNAVSAPANIIADEATKVKKQ